MRMRRCALALASVAVAGAFSVGGASPDPADAAPVAPAIDRGCDTTRIPDDDDLFVANVIVDSRACLKCDELARRWAADYYRTLCVQITSIEAWLFVGPPR